MTKSNSKRTQQNEEGADSIYYVGIGASAGGLEALQDFFKTLPVDTGLVFIVIQHLSPDYKSLMDELLARHTKMSIKVAGDGMETHPNTIYLIPPKNNLSIFHGKLYLEEQKNKKGLNLPIDIFFRSLAADKGKNAIGIILSGTGSDGTLGIRAIKEAGGMVMVQDDQSAKFDGMPRSSISTGLVDYILPPVPMAEELLNFVKHPLIRKSTVLESIMSKNVDTLTKIILVLRDHCGIDFSYYKENTIIRRLGRRVSINRFDTLEEYMEFFSESEKEKDVLYRELLIGVTRFFRDQEAFNSLIEKVIPVICKNKRVVRIWSCGCSTGEEVYSLAMLFKEYISKYNLDCEIKIFATDIDRHALEIASQGFYPESISVDVEQHYITKYFTRRGNGYQISDSIRKCVVFASQNLLKDPPFSKLDLLICRNLFIYLKPDMQQKLLAMFYYSLSPDGYLFMGSSESIGEMNDSFQTIDSKWKIYKYKETFKPNTVKDLVVNRAQSTDLEGLTGVQTRFGNGLKMEKLMESTVTAVLPPSVLIDSKDNILHVFNDVNPYLSIKPGKFSQNIFSNLSSELGLFVGSILRNLKADKSQVIFENISNVKGFENQKITIEARTIVFENNSFFLLSFRNMEEILTAKSEGETFIKVDVEMGSRVSELERQLQVTKENLQATVEELETSNEELQSSNEELIASNEELQSTNEELQSVNEELFTVNSEYQSKIEELIRLNSDLDNLLKNIEVGALYLDRNLCIRKITPVVSKLTNILPTDIGRPISHISVMNFYSSLLDDINNVVETLQSTERDIIDDKNKAWLTRIQPYRTDFNAVEGVIITFIDVDRLKTRQIRSIEETSARLENVLRMGNMAWWEWDVKTGKVIYDKNMAVMLGYRIDEFPDKFLEIYKLLHPGDYDSTMAKISMFINVKDSSYEDTYRIRCKNGEYVWYYSKGTISKRDANGLPEKAIGMVIDLSKQKLLESEFKK